MTLPVLKDIGEGISFLVYRGLPGLPSRFVHESWHGRRRSRCNQNTAMLVWSGLTVPGVCETHANSRRKM